MGQEGRSVGSAAMVDRAKTATAWVVLWVGEMDSVADSVAVVVDWEVDAGVNMAVRVAVVAKVAKGSRPSPPLTSWPTASVHRHQDAPPAVMLTPNLRTDGRRLPTT